MNIDEAIGQLDQLALGGDFPFPHWVGGDDVDQGPSYCRACADAKVEAGEAEYVDGGWPQEEDGCCHCEACGRLLDYTLSDYGVEQELDHYLVTPPKSPLGAEEAYHLSRLLENYHEHPAVLALLPAVEIAIKDPARTDTATQGCNSV